MLANVSPTQNLSDAPAASWLVRGLQNRQQLNLPFGLGVWLCLAAFALPTCQTALSQDLKKSAESPAATEVPAQKKPTDKAEDSKSDQKKNSSAEKSKWKSLLPEKGLEGWAITDFGGQNEVKNTDGQVVIETGEPLAGLHYTKAGFPKDNYEIELEAQRIEGNDFLCGLTFPVAEEFCSLIAGGWGGGVVGLSSVDGYDASENATSHYQTFDNGKWYKFRLRVQPDWITAWIDDKEVIKQERAGHEFSTRIEVYVSRPLGFCAFNSKVGLRNFRWRPVKADEK